MDDGAYMAGLGAFDHIFDLRRRAGHATALRSASFMRACVAAIWRAHPEVGEAFTMRSMEPDPTSRTVMIRKSSCSGMRHGGIEASQAG